MTSYSFCFETSRKYALIQSNKIFDSAAHIRSCLISRVTLLFTLQCQAAIVHRVPLHFTMVEVAENHHRIEVQDQNFRLVHSIQMPFIQDQPFNQ